MSVVAWTLIIERAAETETLSQRIHLWLEAIEQVHLVSLEGPLTVFSPPEATGVVEPGNLPAAQVYALGVLGYTLCTGALPWSHATGADLRHVILTESLPVISHPECPPALLGRINRVIAQATQKDPIARYSSPEILKAEVVSAAAVLGNGRHESEYAPHIHREAYHHIDRWLTHARKGGAPVLAVVGASGIGKTYLWEMIHDTRSLRNERWLYVKAGQAGQRPYETVTQLMEQIPEEFKALIGDASVSPPLRAFVRAIAPRVVPMEVTAEASELRNAPRELARLIARIGARASLRVICFDDFQWSDTYSQKVITELAHASIPVAVAILSREEVHLAEHLEPVYLAPLNRYQAEQFARSLEPFTGSIAPGNFERAFTASAGDPMALHAVLRDGPRVVSPGTQDVLIAVAAQRLAGVSAVCRSVVRLVALTGAHTSLAMLARAGDYGEDELESALAEGERALLVSRSRLYDSVWFVHDSIETAARLEAEDDPLCQRRAIRVLLAEARRGSDRAAYIAIGLLRTIGTDEVSPDDWNWVVTAAARRAVLSLAPEEALRIVEEWRSRVFSTTLQELYLIGHEAAYLLGDRRKMSRYYRAIVAFGDPEAAAEARYLWIRRCYADARFLGAVAVGVRILSGSEVIDESFRWNSDGSQALRFLQRHSPRRILESILRRGYTSDRAARRATDTLGRMLLPVLSTDREHLLHIAYYTLRIGMDRGATPLTALGFIAWALFLGTRRVPGRWVEGYMTCAEELSARSGDGIADHSVRMLIAGFGGPWTGSYLTFSDTLERLQEEGREVGNWEFVAHALHLQRQALLYRGAPLVHLRDTLEESRREIRSYGLVRTDSALAKHHAVVDVLLGRTDDSTHIDGAIVNEREYLQRIIDSNDQMSLAGFRMMKAFLALYADQPEIVLEELTRVDDVRSAISLFHENLLIRFYLGMVAYRLNRPAVGARMLRFVRRWARENPATNRHRLMFIRAERAAFRGHRRIACNMLARAIPLAISGGFFNEAALIAERAGDISGDLHYWMMAESGYRQWGAVHAVARMTRKLGRQSPQLATAASVSGHAPLDHEFSSARSAEEVMLAVARYLLEATHASQVVVLLQTVSPSVQTYRWNGTDPVPAGPPSAEFSLILTETEQGVCRLLSGKDLLRGRAPGIAGRSRRVDESELAVLVVGSDGGGAYSDSMVPTVNAVLRIGVLHAALVTARVRIDLAERELQNTQQQLSATERYRRQLFSTVTDAFLLVDRAGGVRFSNPAAEPYFERGSVASPVLREDIRRPVRAVLDVTGTDKPRHRLQHSTNDRRHLQIQVAPVGSEGEDLVAVSISDITDTVERKEQLAERERQLIVADRLASIGMFSAAIVHEISNPNHILQLNTQSLMVVLSWLRSEIGDEQAMATVDKAGALVDQIEDAAQRVESVLQMVKSYSREGRQEQWEMLAAEEVCSRAFRFSKIMASQFTNRFRLVVDDAIPAVWGEAALLEQALVNLIKNGCEALSVREERVELQAYPSDDGSEAILAVCDTGGGFPAGFADHLGTPFLSDRHEKGGTGLGLSIVSGIVDKHGGYLRAAKDDQFTTRVEIHLPAYMAPSDRTSVSTD